MPQTFTAISLQKPTSCAGLYKGLPHGSDCYIRQEVLCKFSWIFKNTNCLWFFRIEIASIGCISSRYSLHHTILSNGTMATQTMDISDNSNGLAFGRRGPVYPRSRRDPSPPMQTSAISRPYLGYISAISRLHLGYISAISRPGVTRRRVHSARAAAPRPATRPAPLISRPRARQTTS